MRIDLHDGFYLDSVREGDQPAYRGRGLASAAVKALVNYGFRELGYRRIEATAFHDNKASHRVLEKNGFRREGLLFGYHVKNGGLIDAWMFAIVESGHPVPTR
jgi:ribosomal-protein-alanine N-acetyltransferase